LYTPINKNTEYISIIRVTKNFYFLDSEKSAKHVLFFISKGVLDQISIALFYHFSTWVQTSFWKANCRSLSERLLLLVKHSQSGSNWALQCLQSIHL